MNEHLKGYVKYFFGLAILLYVLLSIVFEDKSVLDNLDLAVTLSMFFSVLYSTFLWKYNPLEKNPKIYGEYNMTFVSTYNHSERVMDVTIKQDLLSNRIYVFTTESKSESISSCVTMKKDGCELIYTYQNVPLATERNHSDIHFGTCRFHIVNHKIISGEYYTDRKTTGIIKDIKKIK